MEFDRDEYETLFDEQRTLVRAAVGDGGIVDGSQARDDQFHYSRRLSVVLQLVRWTESRRWPETPIRSGPARSLANALVTTEMRTWASATRTGRLERDLLGFAFTTPEARETWERLGRPSMFDGPPGPQAIAPSGADRHNIGYIPLTRRELFEFPTDPQAIYERLRSVRPENPAAATVFQQLRSAIGIQERPELRAGIYHAFALVPGVRIDADATDAIGRHGTVIRFVRDDQDTDREQQLILDARSYELLGERVAIVDAAASSLDVVDGTITTETVCIRAVTDEPAAP
jgi:hypothetical protein